MNLSKTGVDFPAIGESKLNDTFPTSQFLLTGFKTPYRLDKSGNSGDLLVYVNSDIPSKQIKI